MFDSSINETNCGEQTEISTPHSTTIRKPDFHSVTTLPFIDNEVRVTASVESRALNWARLALFFMEEGYLTDEVKVPSAMQAAQIGFDNWVKQHAQELKVCDMRVTLTPDIAREGYSSIYDQDKQCYVAFDSTNTQLFMLFTVDSPVFITIGHKIQELEAIVPGLGQTLYSILAEKSCDVFGSLTPWSGLDMASYVWWLGADNDEDYISELKANYEEDEELDLSDYAPKPSEVNAAFPEYVTKLENPLSINELMELSTKHDEDWVREVCKVAVDMSQVGDFQLPDLADTEAQSVYVPYMFGWESNDIFERLLDDFFEDANMSDVSTQDCGLVPLPVNDQKRMKSLFSNLERGFSQMKNIERLIKLISVQN